MVKEDFDDFAKLVDETYALISGGKTVLTAGAKVLFFRSLQEYPFEYVAGAMAAHIKDPSRGQFVPKPADLIYQIEGALSSDSRPGVEEAWAIALAAVDENETIVWTEEMSAAFWTCKPVLDQGDEVGARMAFKESYSRLVNAARKAGTPVKWQVTPGKNRQRHLIVYQRNVELGRLPALEHDSPLLLQGPPSTKQLDEASRKGLEMVKAAVAALTPASQRAEQLREAERQKEANRKREIAMQVENYEKNVMPIQENA